MTTTREDVRSALAVQDPEALRAVLAAAGVPAWGAETSVELADRICLGLWWHSSTPVGFAMGKATKEPTLDALIDKAAKRLSVSERVVGFDAWERLDALTRALVSTLPHGPGVALSDVDQEMHARLRGHWKRTVAFGTGAGGSYGARVASGAVLGFFEGPIGRWLPLFPPIAPYVRSIRAGAGAVHAVAGPLGVALAVLSLNQALGPRYRTLLPLLLGVGALGVRPVQDVAEVGGHNNG